LPVYHGSKLDKIAEQGVHKLACEIANGAVRLRVMKQAGKLGMELINVIHPEAYVAPTVRLGKGNFIKSRAVIDTNTVVGNCCIIDNGAVIAHDNVIGNGCHIAPGAILGSGINVGRLAVIGIGASVATGVEIGKSVIISVGSSVVWDVPDYAVIEGVPGKIVGKRKKS
jgi:sugar O-acyltransferase (sialic acid O-acetyltransferase NeuD family)